MNYENFSQIAPPVFHGENYHLWAVRMETYLKALDLWEAVDEDYEVLPLPDNPTVAQIKSQKEKKIRKSKAKATLFVSVSPTIFTRIMGNLGVSEEYTEDERIRGMKVLNLTREFELQKMKESETVKEYSDRLLSIVNKNMHQGFPTETLVRFLKARDGSVSKAQKMLVDCLNWRIDNEIDQILAKPIVPSDFYRGVRDTQLVGMSGYSREGLPVVAVGVGLSTYDKASIHYYIQSHIQMNEYRDRVILPAASKKFGRYIGTCIKVLDMTGLKLSALNQIKLLTAISTIDDLNYPEKTETYYIVNAPYIFSACWKVVRPLLQERTKKKIQVLSGSGKDELLKIMDYASLPHFCKREGSGSSKHSRNGTNDNCFSLDHGFHQQLYDYTKQQALASEAFAPSKEGSVHVTLPEPDPDDAKIAETIESEFQRIGEKNGICQTFHEIKINGD
ncbi:hypothetical protein BC332_19839 [Capsicum chinense]|nr:hypothetical protein BC332_19839 [Capsicum chinense]